MPQAEIVHDRFHVAKNLNEAVDKVRHAEHRKLQDEGEETLTGSKFLFLFAPENLDVERRARLRDLLNRDLKVGRAWMLKEQFRHFWERANARTALSFFVEWYARAVRSRLKPMIAAAKMLKRHLLNLLNYHHYRLTNATAEGLFRGILSRAEIEFAEEEKDSGSRARRQGFELTDDPQGIF